MDPIADMITRIKNAQISGQSSAIFPYSKMKFDLAMILQKEGFLKKAGLNALSHFQEAVMIFLQNLISTLLCPFLLI